MPDKIELEVMRSFLKDLDNEIVQLESIEKMSLGDLTLKEGQELAKSFFSMSALLCFLFGIIWLIGSGAEFGLNLIIFDGLPAWTGDVLFASVLLIVGYWVLPRFPLVLFGFGRVIMFLGIRFYRWSRKIVFFAAVLVGASFWVSHYSTLLGGLFFFRVAGFRWSCL